MMNIPFVTFEHMHNEIKDEVLKNLKKVVKKEEPDCTIEEI